MELSDDEDEPESHTDDEEDEPQVKELPVTSLDIKPKEITTTNDGASKKEIPSKQQQAQVPCQHKRCIIARHLDTKTGTINPSKPKSKCNLCTTHEREGKTIHILEQSLLDNHDDKHLLALIKNHDNKDAPTNLKTIVMTLKPNSLDEKKIRPKLISRIANTLLITGKCGTSHNDIDKRLTQEESNKIRHTSRTICTCPTASAD